MLSDALLEFMGLNSEEVRVIREDLKTRRCVLWLPSEHPPILRHESGKRVQWSMQWWLAQRKRRLMMTSYNRRRAG